MKLKFKHIIFILIIVLTFLLGYSTKQFQLSQPRWSYILKQPHVIAWAAVGTNIAIVFVALFLNIIRDNWNRARFTISTGKEPPFQVLNQSASEKYDLLHVRLKVTNTGRKATEACEVRLEKLTQIFKRNGRKQSLSINKFDPRALKWIGRDTKPIQLNAGSFDFVDLGVLRSDFLENFRIEFQQRGHVDLNYYDQDTKSFRIAGSVYGDNSVPEYFEIEMSWQPFGEISQIRIAKV